MAPCGSRRPDWSPYIDPFFRISLAARSRTTRASHRAAMAGNRPAHTDILDFTDTSLCTGNPDSSKAHEAHVNVHADGEFPIPAADPARDAGGESVFRQTRRFR